MSLDIISTLLNYKTEFACVKIKTVAARSDWIKLKLE